MQRIPETCCLAAAGPLAAAAHNIMAKAKKQSTCSSGVSTQHSPQLLRDACLLGMQARNGMSMSTCIQYACSSLCHAQPP